MKVWKLYCGECLQILHEVLAKNGSKLVPQFEDLSVKESAAETVDKNGAAETNGKEKDSAEEGAEKSSAPRTKRQVFYRVRLTIGEDVFTAGTCSLFGRKQDENHNRIP